MCQWRKKCAPLCPLRLCSLHWECVPTMTCLSRPQLEERERKARLHRLHALRVRVLVRFCHQLRHPLQHDTRKTMRLHNIPDQLGNPSSRRSAASRIRMRARGERETQTHISRSPGATRGPLASAPSSSAASVMSVLRGSWLPDTTALTSSSVLYPSNSACWSSACTFTASTCTSCCAFFTCE